MPIVARDASLIILRGSDVLEFIDGLSTNLVKDLKVGEHVQTVFTDRNAKIIDLCTCLQMDSLVALIGHNRNRERLFNHLSSRILTSDVNIFDATENNDFFIDISKEDNEYDSEITSVRIAESEVLLIARKGTGPEVDMSKKEWDEWRIENLRPDVGHEITEKVHPFSCGLMTLVHTNKGCYIGQEILARMRSRGVFGRELRRLRTEDCKPAFVTTKGDLHCLAIVRSSNQESH